MRCGALPQPDRRGKQERQGHERSADDERRRLAELIRCAAKQRAGNTGKRPHALIVAQDLALWPRTDSHRHKGRSCRQHERIPDGEERNRHKFERDEQCRRHQWHRHEPHRHQRKADDHCPLLTESHRDLADKPLHNRRHDADHAKRIADLPVRECKAVDPQQGADSGQEREARNEQLTLRSTHVLSARVFAYEGSTGAC